MIDKNVLPVDFDGVFRFTNFTEHEFKAKWNSVEYTFPPLSTIPLIIPGATPEEVQTIRKKFAKELAVACFYQSAKFKAMEGSVRNANGEPTGGVPALYTDSDIAPFVQRCLEPLPVGQATVKKLISTDEDKLTKDEEGKPRTRVITGKKSVFENSGEPVKE